MFLYKHPQSGGSAMNDFFWQFVGGGAGPGNIETKAANGVTGINTPLSTNTDIKLVLLDDGVTQVSANIIDDTTEVYASGVSIEAGQKKALLFYTDLINLFSGISVDSSAINIVANDNGDGYRFIIDTNQAEETIIDALSPGSFLRRTFKKFRQEIEAQDVPGGNNTAGVTDPLGDNMQSSNANYVSYRDQAPDRFRASVSSALATSEHVLSSDIFEVKVLDGTVGQQQKFSVDGDNINYTDQANGLLFKINRAGQIHTNQVTAGAHVTPAGEIAVRNPAGAIVGYIQLFN